MAQVGKMLKQDKVSYAETEFSAKLPQTEQDAKVQQMLAKANVLTSSVSHRIP